MNQNHYLRGGKDLYTKLHSLQFIVSFCLKIFHKQVLDNGGLKQKERKLSYMIKNRPKIITGKTYKLCWPEILIYKNKHKKNFQGFIMPLAYPQSIILYELCQVTPKNLGPEWSKYSREKIEGIKARLKLCVNIAVAIHSIHSVKKYVLVDFKPENVLITHSGKVSIIDIDSIQIQDPKTQKVLFATRVSTPEFMPPEATKYPLGKSVIPIYWDLFSLGVVFYKILFGLHPYTATPQDTLSNLSQIDQKIKHGLFPHGKKKQLLQVIPRLHDKFSILPVNIKRLFLKCFDSGHMNPSTRPTAEEWGKIFHSELINAEKITSRVPQPIPSYPTPSPTKKLSAKKIDDKKLSSKKSNNKWCFIATVVYGSIEAPQVEILRKFRDIYLTKSLIGRGFIELYYRYSPSLANSLKEHPQIIKILRLIMFDPLVSFIKKKLND